jgi:hypothetical protein
MIGDVKALEDLEAHNLEASVAVKQDATEEDPNVVLIKEQSYLGKRSRRNIKWVRRWVSTPNIFEWEPPIWTMKWIPED